MEVQDRIPWYLLYCEFTIPLRAISATLKSNELNLTQSAMGERVVWETNRKSL
jgi:hypothetical protein